MSGANKGRHSKASHGKQWCTIVWTFGRRQAWESIRRHIARRKASRVGKEVPRSISTLYSFAKYYQGIETRSQITDLSISHFPYKVT